MIKALLYLAVLAVVVYAAVWLVQRRGTGGRPPRPHRPHLRRAPAPDDDPGFLRELDDRLWQQRRERQRKPEPSDTPGDDEEDPPGDPDAPTGPAQTP